MRFNFKIGNHQYTNCLLRIGKYAEGNIAVSLVGDCGEGWDETIDTLTYNLGMVPRPDCQAVVKDNDFERGIVTQLEDMGVILGVVGFTKSGYYDRLPVCQFDMEKLVEYTKD